VLPATAEVIVPPHLRADLSEHLAEAMRAFVPRAARQPVLGIRSLVHHALGLESVELTAHPAHRTLQQIGQLGERHIGRNLDTTLRYVGAVMNGDAVFVTGEASSALGDS